VLFIITEGSFASRYPELHSKFFIHIIGSFFAFAFLYKVKRDNDKKYGILRYIMVSENYVYFEIKRTKSNTNYTFANGRLTRTTIKNTKTYKFLFGHLDITLNNNKNYIRDYNNNYYYLSELQNLRIVYAKNLHKEMHNFDRNEEKYVAKEVKREDNGLKKYYEILGVKNLDADMAEIKKAYRQKAMKWHPDKNNDSEESRIKFNEIKEAYDIVSKKK
jgi:hypothetical protein